MLKIVLGLVFRQKGADGSYYGGPMYYIEKGLHARLLGVAAAVLLFFQNAGGTLIQSNTISDVGLSGIWSPESSHRDFNGGCHGFHYRRRT